MEDMNGYGRPLDRMVRASGCQLYNVNNLRLARFREIFPRAAKTDRLDTRRILDLFRLKDHLFPAKDVLQEAPRVPLVNEKVRVVDRTKPERGRRCSYSRAKRGFCGIRLGPRAERLGGEEPLSFRGQRTACAVRQAVGIG